MNKGYCIEPRLFANLDDESRIAQEEFFGPLPCLIPAEYEEEAIRLANQGNFGLDGWVLTTDPEVAYDISHRVCALSLRSADPTDPQLVEHRLLGSEDDLQQLVAGMQIARRIMADRSIADQVVRELRPGVPADGEALRDYVRAATKPMYHPVGTARMGSAGDPDAAVGAELQVNGVPGLWIADASVMLTIPAGNTNATAIMIGDKASDHILRSL